ncbi:hypothetical protein ABGV43_29130 [Paenibacillus amylolyticus]|uniref:hypothetical protein n=1 Tax=Paenibacillus amylolyticus TaxID=1451 RepID=UPI003241E7C5
MFQGKVKLFGLSLPASLMFTVTSTSLYAAPIEPKEGLFFATTEESTDTAKWVITPDWLPNLQSTDNFQLGTSWKAASAYPYTGLQISHVTEWHSAVEHMFDLSNTFNVGYNW